MRWLLGLSLVVLTTSALAHGEVGDEPCRTEASLVHGPTLPLGGDRELTLLPGSRLYPRYLADPRQPMMKAMAVHVIHSDTLETGDFLYEFTLGGSYGLARLHSAREPEHGLELGRASCRERVWIPV